jgi:plasmid stabilization system protein ParE
MTLRVDWSVQARNQFVATLTYIAKEDPLSADMVRQRVEKSLKLLCKSPAMGVSAPTAGVRTYIVPKTGHNFDYRLVRDQIRIQRWYRQRQRQRHVA